MSSLVILMCTLDRILEVNAPELFQTCLQLQISPCGVCRGGKTNEVKAEHWEFVFVDGDSKWT